MYPQTMKNCEIIPTFKKDAKTKLKLIIRQQTYAVPQKYLKYNSSANAIFGK